MSFIKDQMSTKETVRNKINLMTLQYLKNGGKIKKFNSWGKEVK